MNPAAIKLKKVWQLKECLSIVYEVAIKCQKSKHMTVQM